jgi:hypothetical protein
MIKKDSQISLTMELEGSVLLRKNIKTKVVKLLRTYKDHKTGVIKPLLNKKGEKQYITEEVVYEEPVYEKAIRHMVLPYSFIVNALEQPIKGFKVNVWKRLSEEERIKFHILDLSSHFHSKILSYTILD